MKRWLLVPVAVVAVVLVWLALDPERREAVTAAIGLSAPTSASKLAKPICDSPVNPNVAAPTDCIPAHLANLPPDPGEAGKATVAGIDTANRGYRDDVHIWLVQNWGHSPRAMALLTMKAKTFQQHVVLGGDTISAEEAHKMFDRLMSVSVCYGRGETPEMFQAQALEWLKLKTTNTPERYQRYWDFSNLFGHHAFAVKDETVTEACGFDPEALPTN